MKPDQERVNNLLRDTVTLLCKNGLTYNDELRVEALIGVTVDSNDVFLVHINERFGPGGENKSDRSTPAVEPAINNGGQACNSGNGGNKGRDSAGHTPQQSPAHGTQRTGSSDSGSVASPGVGWGSGAPSRQAAPQVDLSRVKLESVDVGEDIDSVEDCLVVRSPQAVAHQARMVAGQRRAYSRHNSASLQQPTQASSSVGGDDAQAMRQQYSQSHSMASSDGSFTDYDPDTGEPPLKIKKQAAEDQGDEGEDDDSAYYHGGGSGQENAGQSQWPNLSDLAAHQAHQAFQETGDGHLGADAGSTLPGCSTWPMPAGSQRSLIPGTPGSDMPSTSTSSSMQPSSSASTSATKTTTATTTRNSSTPSRSPQWRMASQQLKAVLTTYLVRPVVQAARSVCGFRMIWRTANGQPLDQIWNQIIAHRLHLDTLLQDIPGVELVVSSITGTISNHRGRPGNPVDTFPAVAYWLVAPRDFNPQVLYDRMSHSGTGASLKVMLHQALSSTAEREISATLFLVMKDYVEGGFVRRRVDAADPGITSGRHPIVRFLAKDQATLHSLQVAQAKLAEYKCPVSTEFF